MFLTFLTREHFYILIIIMLYKYQQFIFFSAQEQAEFNKSCNLIGSWNGQNFSSGPLQQAESVVVWWVVDNIAHYIAIFFSTSRQNRKLQWERKHWLATWQKSTKWWIYNGQCPKVYFNTRNRKHSEENRLRLNVWKRLFLEVGETEKLSTYLHMS